MLIIERRKHVNSVYSLLVSSAALLSVFRLANACQFIEPKFNDVKTFSLYLNCSDPLELLNINVTSKLENVTHVLVQCDNLFTRPPQLTLPAPLRLKRLKALKVKGCGIDAVRLLTNLKYENQLYVLDLSNNSMTGFEWRLAKQFNAQNLNVGMNHINCSCPNKWIFDSIQKSKNETTINTAHFLQLPSTVHYVRDDSSEDEEKCDIVCPNEEIKLLPPIIDTKLKATAILRCRMNGSLRAETAGTFKPEDLFRWMSTTDKAMEERKQRWDIVKESDSVYKMEIRDLRSDDLGIVVCECLECVTPNYAYSEFRFDTSITAKIEQDNEGTHLTVHGYPLRNLTMTLRRLNDDVEETKDLQVKKSRRKDTKFFSDGVTVRYNADHSYAMLKFYHFLMKEDTVKSDYEMTICTPREDDCVNATFTLGHPTLHHDSSIIRPNKSPGTSTFAYFFFALLVLAAIGALMLSTFHYYRRDKTASKLATAVGWHKKGRFRRISRNTNRTEETSLRMDDTLSATMSNYSLQHVPLIDKDHLVLEEKIGKGAFGEVFVGEWLTRGIRVAVKTLHNVQVDAQMDKEAAMLSALDHENVVKMFGVSRAHESQNLYLVLELMNMGDLKSYVKAREPRCDNYSQFPPALLHTELINIAQQICNGLCYIHNQQIVHRDLAARNCLVAGESDMRVCAPAFRPPVTVKISDFGMSRRLYSQAEYYKMGDNKTALPVRWLPPECLESGRFTYQSDIWAFGVTLYELFTYGSMPYGDLSNNEALMAVISGVRPTVPQKSPPEIAEIMRDCWKTAPDERPCAVDSLTRLKMLQ